MKKLLAFLTAVLMATSAVVFAEEKKPTVTKLEAQDETVVVLQKIYKQPFEVYKVEAEKEVAVFIPVKFEDVESVQLWNKDGTAKVTAKAFEDGTTVLTSGGYLVVFSKQPRELGVIEEKKEEPNPTEATKPVESKPQKDKVPNTGAHK